MISVSSMLQFHPFYDWVVVHVGIYVFFIHSSVDGHWGCFHPWLLWRVLQLTWACQLISFPLNKFPVVELLAYSCYYFESISGEKQSNFFFFILFYFFFGNGKGERREWEISKNTCNRQGWARAEQGSLNAVWVWVTHLDGGIQVFEPSPAASQGVHYQKAGTEPRVRTQTGAFEHGMKAFQGAPEQLYQMPTPVFSVRTSCASFHPHSV